MTTVPLDTVCANAECGHTLREHYQFEVEPPTVSDLKARVKPCLWSDRETGMFTVCGCRDFELSEPKAPEPIAPEIAPPTPEDNEIVFDTIIAGVFLNFHRNGAVTWAPVPGVKPPSHRSGQ